MRTVTGIRASGRTHLGDYVSVMRGWSELDVSNAVFVVADLHGLTNLKDEQTVVRRGHVALESAAWAIACGVDPHLIRIAVQSRIPLHLELAFYLSALGRPSDLHVLPQWKEFTGGLHSVEPSIAAYYDPVLMAADILLYQASSAFVRQDQAENVRLASQWAANFNQRFGELFLLPEAVTVGVGWYPRDLRNPGTKMSSKSSSLGTILLSDSSDEIRRKVMAAVTDRESQVYLGRQKPGVSNLIRIAAELQNMLPDAVQNTCANMTYDQFKSYIADLVIAIIEPIRLRYLAAIADSDELNRILDRSTEVLTNEAQATITSVRTAVGIV